MSKNTIISVVVVIVLGLGVWWITARTTTKDAMAPTVTTTISTSPSISPNPNITITSPKANAVIESPITVTGTARVFENQFTVQIKNSSGDVIAQEHVFSDAPDAGQFGNYSVKIPIPVVTNSNLIIEALSYSAKGDGSFEGYARVPVTLKTLETIKVSVAFPVSPIGNNCEKVTLFPRQITKTSEVAFASVYELLKGSTDNEKDQSVSTQIPDGVKLNSIRKTGDTIYVDFDEMLQYGVSGSCRVLAIRSQITNTLKQFAGVNNVVISINGKIDGILQP